MKIFRLFFVTLFFILLANVSVTSQLIDQATDSTVNQDAQLLSDQVSVIESSASKKIHLAYTTAYDSNKITPVDLMTGLTGNPLLSQYNPKTIVIAPDAQTAYLFMAGINQIIPIDLTTGLAELPILLQSVPKTMIIDSESQLAYVIYENTNQITKLDLSNGQAGDWVFLDHFPDYLSLDSSEKVLYVGYQNLNEITLVDLTSATVLPSLFLKDALQGMITTQEGKTICINQNEANAISFLNMKRDASNQIVLEEEQLVNLDKRIQGASLSADGEVMYVTYENSTEITPINLTHKIVNASIHLGQAIQSMTLYPRHELIASFTAHMAPVGKPSLFDASLSKPFKGSIVDYQWDFGDGQVLLVETPVVTHAYEKSGVFNVNLTVTEMLENFPFQSSENEILTDPLTPLKTQVVQSVEVLDLLKNNQNASVKLKKDLFNAPGIIPSTTTLSSSAPTLAYGQTVTFTAMVSGASGIPTGIVTFSDTVLGALGTGNLDGTGTATFSTSTLTVGSYSIVASYPGDATYAPSDSSASPLSLTVTQSTTTTVLTSSANPSSFGLLTLTATITNPGTGIPTGTVTFSEGSTTLGTGTVNGGVATFSASTLAPGPHTLTATYNGDSNFTGSMSAPLSQTVTLATTTTSLSSDTPMGTFGVPITFTASVTAASGAGNPSGTVTFKDGTTTIGSPVPLVSGQASIMTSSLSVGTHSVTAVYSGDSDFAASTSSPPLPQPVNAGTTSVNLTSSANPSTYGQSITFTATVSILTGVGPLVGSVTFNDGTITLGTVPVNSAGIATWTTNGLPVGPHSITAVYGSDPNFSTSTSIMLNQTVGKGTPTITLSSVPNPSAFGGTVILTSTVSDPTLLGLPSGIISFYDGTTLIGTGILSGTGPNTSTATISISNFNAGTHPLTAVYSGDGNFISVTSAVVYQLVNQAISTGTSILSTSSNPTEYGQPVNLTAIITGFLRSTGSPVAPTGTVIFYDGSNPITGPVPVTPLANSTLVSVATASVTSLTVAGSPHTLTADYSGDVNYPASNSIVPVLQRIINTNTSTFLTSSVNPSDFQQSVTFTAVVSSVAPGGGNPTGTVNFYNGATLIGNGILVTGSPGSNASTATVPTSALALGSHFITAVYGGDPNFNSSSSNLLKQAVTQTPTTITLSSSDSPSAFGEPITITASITAISPGGGTPITPTGTVQFYDGTTFLGTGNVLANSTATFSTFQLYPGTHTLTAIYSGDTNFTPSTTMAPQLVQTVIPTLPTITTIIASSRNSSPTGLNVTFTAQVTAAAGVPGGTVTFFVGPTMVSGPIALSNGIASFPVSGTNFLSNGEYDITAVYADDALGYYDPSISAIYQQFIVPINTSVVLTSAPNHSTQAGATFTAVVSPPPPPMQVLPGTVNFYDSGVLIDGTVNFDDTTGIATLTPNDLHFNARSITAVYTGDQTTYAMAVSNSLTQQVQQTDMLTTTTTISTPTSATYICQPIILTAHVMVTSEGFYNPTGSVTFFDGTIEIGTALLDTSGPTFSVAMLPISNLAVGSHVLSATYNSDSNYAFSQSTTITQTIMPNNTATTFSIIPAITPTPFGENIILSAMVTATFGIPTGTIVFSSETGVLGEIVLDSTGAAFLAINTLPVGSHTITANYNANSCFNGSTAVITHGLSPINPVTTLTSPQSPTSVYGQAVTFNATVTSPVGTPTGTVSFYNGTNYPQILLGTAPIIEGLATLTTSSLPPGVLTINATYSGDGSFSATGLASLIQTVTKTPTTVCLISNPDPSVFGQTVTLTATLSSSVPQPTGQIIFNLGMALLGTVDLNGCEMAILQTTALPVGANTITATYTGDTNFLASLPTTVIQTVTADNTMTTVTSTPNPSAFGTAVAFNVTVAAVNPGSGTPTGSVTGFLGTQSLGTGTLTNGIASFTTSVIPVGNQTITVKYTPDTANYITSTGIATQIVIPVTSTTVLTSSGPTNAVFGQPVTLTARVTPTTATGTVTFLYGTTTLGSQVLTASELGVATLVVSTLPVGANTNTLTAVYSGNANIASSTSAPISQAVVRASTTTTLSSFTNPSYYGESVTFTAAVAAVSPATGIPTGLVTFFDGATSLGTVTLINGQASVTATNLSTGSHTMTATYTVTTNYATSTSTALTQIVGKNATTTNAAYSTVNNQVTVTVIPNNPINTGAALPTGTVNVYAGATKVGTATITTGGTVTFTPTIPIPAGSQTLEVQYSGDGNYLSSTTPLALNIAQVISTTNLTASPNPSTFGQSVTLTATVVANSLIPTGTVSFLSGTTTIGTQLLTTADNGTVTLMISTLPVGTETLTAVYSGNSAIAGSTSSVISQFVQISGTTTTLSSLTNPSYYGESVTFTAAVAAANPGAAIPTGIVTFSDAGNPIGTAPLINGQASYTATNLSTASHAITATYGVTTNYAASTSAALTQNVGKNATTTLATYSTVTHQITVTVVPINPFNVGTTLPTGTVNVYSGTTNFGPATITTGGTVTFTPTVPIPAGTHLLEVQYVGDANYQSSSTTLALTIAQVSSTNTLTNSPTSSVFGQPVTLTAVITPSTATGTVSFLSGTTTIGTQFLTASDAGTVSFMISTLPVGTDTITAVYSGNSAIAGSTSNSVIQLVSTSPTTTTLFSTLNPSFYGQPVTFNAVVTAAGLNAGIPTGGTVSFMDGTTLLGTVTLINGQAFLTTPTALSTGPHSITATYSGTGNFAASPASATLTQTVNPSATNTSATATLTGNTVNLSVIVSSLNTLEAGSANPSGPVNVYYGSALVGTGTVTNGIANFALTGSIPAGNQTLEVQYGGDTNFQPSSTTATLFIPQVVSTTALISSPNSSAFGQPVTLTATVTPSTGTAIVTGTVAFLLNGTITLGTETLNANGIATLILANLPVGTTNNVLTAVYSGNAAIAGSTSPFVTQVVTASNTFIFLSSESSPSFYGDTVTFNASVAATNSAAGIPTGMVNFMDGTVLLGTGTLINGQASFATDALTTGPHSITAVYVATTNFNGSKSAITSQQVNPIPTSISVTPMPAAITAGETLTFTASVTALIGSEVPTGGTVQAYSGSTLLQTVSLTAGTASFSIPSLPAGTLAIELKYTGDNMNFLPSATTLTQTANLASSTTTLSPLSSSVFGQPVTLTATITTAYAPFTGSVTFFDGTTNLGTVMNINPATITLNALAVGSHSITAVYSGAPNIASSTSSPALTQIVTQANTTTTLAVPASATYGDLVTFNATVAPIGLGMGIPTGTVTFSNGATVLGTRPVNSTGQAFFSTNLLGAGAYSITATYNGDSDFITSASAAAPSNLIINKANPTLDLLSSWPNPSMISQNVNFFAAVHSNVGQPTGNITFYSDGSSPINVLGTINIFDGLAILTTNVLSIGNHIITATYSGDANFNAATFSSLIQVVTNITTPSTTDVLFTATPPIQDFGQPVLLAVQVQQIQSKPVPTGNVTFYYGSNPIITVGLDNMGFASYTTSSLPAGNLQLVAIYSGDSVYAFATKIIIETINPINTMTTLVSSLNPSYFGDAVTFTATVTTASGITPTSSVTFYEGSTILGTFLLNNRGIATYTTSTLAPGDNIITATYNADSNFVVSSGSVTQTVTQAPASTIILNSSINPSKVGESVTFVATVASSAGTPEGSMTFYDGLNPLGTVSLYNGLAIFTVPNFTLGSHVITAVYSGNAIFNSSVSQPYTQIVNQSTLLTTAILSSSLNPADSGQLIQLTAALNSSGVTPTGTVTFFDGSMAVATVMVDQNGLAVFSTSNLSLGTHPITAVYSGDVNYSPATSAVLFQIINASQIPNAPQNFHGYQVKNKFANQTNLINILTWDAPLTGSQPLSYKIYRDAQLNQLVAHVSAKHSLKYKDFDVKKNKRYTYYIVAITSSGVSSPSSVIVYPENETCEVELISASQN